MRLILCTVTRLSLAACLAWGWFCSAAGALEHLPGAAQSVAAFAETPTMTPMAALTSEAGLFASWRADHQERAARDGWIKTDRPSFTLSDSTVPMGWLQVESGYLYSFATFTPSSGGRGLPQGDTQQRFHTLPELNLRYGLNQWCELRVEWAGVALQQIESNGWTETYTSFAGLEVGLKLQVTQQRGWIPRSAFVPSLVLPTSSSVSRVGSTLDYIYTWDLTERFSIGGSTGAVFLDIENINFNNGFQSVIARFQFSPRFSVFCEYYGFFRGDFDDFSWSPLGDMGVQWRPLANLQIDWRIGLPLEDVDPPESFFTGVGASVRY